MTSTTIIEDVSNHKILFKGTADEIAEYVRDWPYKLPWGTYEPYWITAHNNDEKTFGAKGVMMASADDAAQGIFTVIEGARFICWDGHYYFQSDKDAILAALIWS